MTHRYSETLRAIAPILAEHRQGWEMLRILARHEKESGDRQSAEWTTAEAVYYVGSLWHAGQGDPLYAAMCAVDFRPGALWRKPEGYGARGAAAEMVRTLTGRTVTP